MVAAVRRGGHGAGLTVDEGTAVGAGVFAFHDGDVIDQQRGLVGVGGVADGHIAHAGIAAQVDVDHGVVGGGHTGRRHYRGGELADGWCGCR